MSFLPDWRIQEAAENYGLIDPFIDHLVEEDESGNGLLSYGLDSYGYSVRVNNRFKMLSPSKKYGIIDPKNFNEELMTEIVITDGSYFLLPPGHFALCETVEKFNFARNMTGYIAIKSTYARCGLLISAAAIEPEWGEKICRLTVEVSNATPLPMKIYINEGIVQVQFQENKENCKISYADRKGKYNSHQSLVPIVKNKG